MIRKMQGKKVIAIVLCLLILTLAMAGCSGNNNDNSNDNNGNNSSNNTNDNNSSNNDEDTNDSSNDTSNDADDESSDELVTLTGAIFLESIEGSAIKTDPVSEYIRDRFGIQFEIISDCAGNTWNEKFPAMLAAGELPDIFWVVQDAATGYAGQFQKLVDANAIVCLDDYPELFEEYNADPILEAEMDYHRTFISPDGKAYGFPMYFGESNYAKGLVNTISLRWDAYEAAGSPEFSNYDELADVLKAMQDVAQTDVNGDMAYGVSGWFGEGQGWGDWEMLYSYGQSIAYNSAAVQYKNETEISDVNFYASEESPYWEYLAFMNKSYRLGIIDPDAFIMTWDEYNAQMENGSFLYCSAGWLTGQKNDIISANLEDDNAGFVHFPAPSDYEDYYYGGAWDYGTGCTYAISNNCTDVEAAIEILTWISSQEGSLIMENGPEGLAWNYDENGVPVGNDDYLVMGQFDSQSYEMYGSNLYHHLKGYSDATALSEFGGVTANLRLSDKANEVSMTPYEESAMELFGATSFTGENWLNRANTTFTFDLVSACGAVPSEYTMSAANIVNEFYNRQFEAIQASTVEEFEEIKAEMIEYAIANSAIEIQEYYKGVQDNFKDDLKAIADKIGAALAG